MKKNEMTWQVMLIEAVGIVSAIAYLGLQIYYGIAFHVNPVNLMMNLVFMILVYVVLGGIGNIRGSIIAAVILTLLPELLRGLSDYRMLIYAIVLIIMMLFNWAPKAIEWREKYLHFGKKKEA